MPNLIIVNIHDTTETNKLKAEPSENFQLIRLENLQIPFIRVYKMFNQGKVRYIGPLKKVHRKRVYSFEQENLRTILTL